MVFVFLQYVQRFNQPITQIAVLWTNIQSAIAGGERIFGLLDEPVDLENKPDASRDARHQGQGRVRRRGGGLQDRRAGARGISFTAEPGQTIAIVGPTGAGKTTIINLIPRFYDVTGGAVRIDGIDVRDVHA